MKRFYKSLAIGDLQVSSLEISYLNYLSRKVALVVAVVIKIHLKKTYIILFILLYPYMCLCVYIYIKTSLVL